MALPQEIPVRYTEEEAGYVSFRPVVRQTFRVHELLDMILSVTGKQPERIRQILRSGTVVFHFYRYWWEGFEASEAELQALLAEFPDADAARAFRAENCTKAFVDGDKGDAVHPPRHAPLEIDRRAASRKRWVRRRSFWDVLMAAAAAGPLAYDSYSYMFHADLYRLPVTAELRATLANAVASLAPREMRRELSVVNDAARILFACPRAGS
jgi:hypothetical protein